MAMPRRKATGLDPADRIAMLRERMSSLETLRAEQAGIVKQLAEDLRREYGIDDGDLSKAQQQLAKLKTEFDELLEKTLADITKAEEVLADA